MLENPGASVKGDGLRVALQCATRIGPDPVPSVRAPVESPLAAKKPHVPAMLLVVALNLLQSLEIMASVSRLLADSAIEGFTVRSEHINQALDRNPILVTALNSVIGYEKGAATAKKAYADGRPIKEVALETTGLSKDDLDRLLDPLDLTRGGIKK